MNPFPTPIRPGEGEEQHHEKKPVLKVVKDKVKKIKNTISKKAHNGNDNDGNDEGRHPQGDQYDDVFEENEELEEDPDVHGAAAVYENSAAVGAGSGDNANARTGAKVKWGKVEEEDKEDEMEGFGDNANARTGAKVKWGKVEEEEEDKEDGIDLKMGDFVQDPSAPPKNNGETKNGIRTERIRDENEVDVSPELCQSLEAMTVSNQNDGESVKQAPNDEVITYTDFLSSNASKVYGKVADAGSAVIAKVKPDSGKDGGVRSLEGNGSGEGEKGSGVVDMIKGTVTSYLGGGGGARESPKNKEVTLFGKDGDENRAFQHLLPESKMELDKVKDAGVRSPERNGSDEGEKGSGVVDKIKGTVTSYLGGGGGARESPKNKEVTLSEKDDDENRAIQHRQPESKMELDKVKVGGDRSMEDNGSGGKGSGVVDMIKGTVTSYLGGGGGAREPPMNKEVPLSEKDADENKAFQHSQPESKVKPDTMGDGDRSMEENGSGKGAKGSGWVDTIKGTVTSYLGGGAPESPMTKEVTSPEKDGDGIKAFQHPQPEAIYEEKGSE